MNKFLLIVAHGSRLKESNEEIISFTKKIQDQSYDNTIVKYAFLELAKPAIDDVIDSIVAKYSKEIKIDILPYFLAEGRHVKEDIPNQVNNVLNKYPTLQVKVLPHLGKTDGLISLILDNYK